MKKLVVKSVVAALLTVGFAGTAVAQTQAATTQELSRLIRTQALTESRASQERLRIFGQQKAQQQTLLNNAKAEVRALEKKGEDLKKSFDANELLLADKENLLNERLGSLKELFGHLTGAAGDADETISTSIVSAQYPGRTDFIPEMVAKMSSSTELPSVEEIHRLWSEMHDELTRGGEVVKFTAEVITPAGETQNREIVRVGNYNLVSNGEYLEYDSSTNNIGVLPAQPKAFADGALELQNASSGVVKFGVDPTGPSGGNFLKAVVAQPSWGERLWEQGGVVGYVLMFLLGLALFISILKLAQLMIVGGKVRSQLKAQEARTNNPLGRIMKVYEDNNSVDVESLELKLNEAILKERPGIEAWLNALKIIAAVGPLLGLLGTVTGMILTFQGIALYGAGDVGGMAGGISQALITTVWGLLVAIPTILLHTLVNSQAMRLIHVLDEQAAGIVAERAEGK